MKLEKLEQIMREEAEKVLAGYEEEKGIELDTDVKKDYIQTALDTISEDEAGTEEEARELYREWLEDGLENLEA